MFDRLLGRERLRNALREARDRENVLIGRISLLQQSNAHLMQTEASTAQAIARLREQVSNLTTANNNLLAVKQSLEAQSENQRGHYQESK